MALNDSKEKFVWKFIKANNVPIFKKTYEFAWYYHCGHFRKDGSYYFGHPNELCYVLLINNIREELILSAAIGHDVVEELREQSNIIMTPEDILKEIGDKNVAEDIFALTKPKKEMNQQEVEEYFKGIAINIRRVLVKMADRYCNMRRTFFKESSDEKLRRYYLETSGPILLLSEEAINSGLYPEYECYLRMMRSGLKGFLEAIQSKVEISF